MAARITREQASRWQVITPFQLGDKISDMVAVEITTAGPEITVKMIGSNQPITFPLERAKMFSDALREAVETVEKDHAPSP